MGDVLNHYEDHLADIYSWIYGDFHARLRANHDFFEMHGIVGPGNAIDLGAGPGYQSIALCDLGFSVTAADFSAKLLESFMSEQARETSRHCRRTFSKTSGLVAPLL